MVYFYFAILAALSMTWHFSTCFFSSSFCCLCFLDDLLWCKVIVQLILCMGFSISWLWWLTYSSVIEKWWPQIFLFCSVLFFHLSNSKFSKCRYYNVCKYIHAPLCGFDCFDFLFFFFFYWKWIRFSHNVFWLQCLLPLLLSVPTHFPFHSLSDSH